MDPVSRRRFLQATGLAATVATAASRPARAGPKPRAKTLTDSGRGSDRLTIAVPSTGGGDTFHELYGDAEHGPA